jgi:ketosteroid isomerase-like protein
MKKIMAIALLLTAAAPLARGQTAGQGQTTTAQPGQGAAGQHVAAEQQIEQVEREWDSAILGRKRAELERLMADDYTNYSDDEAGGKGKKEFIDFIMAVSAPQQGSTVRDEMSNVRRIANGETVIVTGNIMQIGSEQRSPKMRFTHVWARRNGKWQLIGDQFIAVPQSQGAGSMGGTK